mgnify:CR=1 FL=1
MAHQNSTTKLEQLIQTAHNLGSCLRTHCENLNRYHNTEKKNIIMEKVILASLLALASLTTLVQVSFGHFTQIQVRIIKYPKKAICKEENLIEIFCLFPYGYVDYFLKSIISLKNFYYCVILKCSSKVRNSTPGVWTSRTWLSNFNQIEFKFKMCHTCSGGCTRLIWPLWWHDTCRWYHT